MTLSLIETWQSARFLASKEPALKPKLSELVEQDTGEVERTIAQLRETHRDDAVELTAIARAVAARSDLEVNGVHRQVQLLLLPVLVQVEAGPAGEPKYLPDLPAGLTIETTLCRTLGLEPDSLKVAPFLVSAAALAELSMAEIRELGMHLFTMGDYGKLSPALLEREPDQPSRYTLHLPLVWNGEPDAALPAALSEQGLRPSYMEAKYRLEELLEKELLTRCELRTKVTAFKPVSFPMAFGFVRRATLFMDLRQMAKESGGFEGAHLEWRRSKDLLSLEVQRNGKQFKYQASLPEEGDTSLSELMDQLGKGLKVASVHRLS